MKKITDENKIEILKNGKTSDFWKLVQETLKDSIQHLQGEVDSEEMKDLPAERYKLENELIKAKKQYLKKLLEFPDSLMAWLANPNAGPEENFDPYETPDEQ